MNKRPLTQTWLAVWNIGIDIVFLCLGVWFFNFYFQINYFDTFLLGIYGLMSLVYLFISYRTIDPTFVGFFGRILKRIGSALLAGLVVSGLLSLLLFTMYGTDLVLLLTLLVSVVISTIIFELVAFLLFKNKDNRVHVLFVGVGTQTESIISRFKDSNGFYKVGILDNVAKKDEQIGGALVTGKINTLEDVLDQKRVDLIVQTGANEHTVTIMTLAEHKRIRFLVVPELLGINGRAIDSVSIEQKLFIEPKGTKLSGWAQVGKRLFDLVISLLLLIILSPIFLLIAVISLLASMGAPVFVGQKRVDGRSGREFTLWRFRTLGGIKEPEPTKDNYKEFPHIVKDNIHHAKANWFGNFLRRSRLMDLPNLWNVFVGDMGLVGPRPPFKVEYDSYDWIDRKRVLIKPGITGLWQLNRKEHTFDEMIKLDREYIENWSFWLDLKIILLTIVKFVFGRL